MGSNEFRRVKTNTASASGCLRSLEKEVVVRILNVRHVGRRLSGEYTR